MKLYYNDRMREFGGPGSGNFGHAGIPGQVGGSAPGAGTLNIAISTNKTLYKKYARGELDEYPKQLIQSDEKISAWGEALRDLISDDGVDPAYEYMLDTTGIEGEIRSKLDTMANIESELSGITKEINQYMEPLPNDISADEEDAIIRVSEKKIKSLEKRAEKLQHKYNKTADYVYDVLFDIIEDPSSIY